MERYLFFDGSDKFSLRKRFYVVAGVVGELETINKILGEAEREFGKISKKNRPKLALEVGEFFVNKVSDKFQINLFFWDNRLSEINAERIKNWVSKGNNIENDFEKGKWGIIGRFWAQCQWLPVQNLKVNKFAPVLWMDKEEEIVIKICKDHFKNQTKDIEGSFIGVQHSDKPKNFSEKDLERFLCIPDYLSYCLRQALNGRKNMFLNLYISILNPFFTIFLMKLTKDRIQTFQLKKKVDVKGPTKIEDVEVFFEEDNGEYFFTTKLSGGANQA